ncbi:hypothetical protein BH20ACI3_BH20ACI3_31480 [soil metagenome]
MGAAVAFAHYNIYDPFQVRRNRNGISAKLTYRTSPGLFDLTSNHGGGVSTFEMECIPIRKDVGLGRGYWSPS